MTISRMLRRFVLAASTLCYALLSHPAVADSRQVFTAETYPWLRAIGKLQVPGSRYRNGRREHHREDCSATLVAPANSERADTIITAWHCLEFYNDLSKSITFTLTNSAGEPLQRAAHTIATGGSLHADWAVLRLQQAVFAHQVMALPLVAERANSALPIIMAGFSRDHGIGNRGNRLSFDPACSITEQGKHSSDTNCTAHKGASGGPVIQLDQVGQPQLCGVISQGNGVGLSTFVPVASFRYAASGYIK